MSKQTDLILAIQAQKIIIELIEKHPEYKTILSKINVIITGKLTRTAGKANTTKNYIKLSSYFFSRKEDYDAHFRSTVIHELAHIVANTFYGRNCEHNPLWRAMDIKLGGTGEKFHTMSGAYGSYICPGCNFSVTLRKNHIQELHKYRCPKCKSNINSTLVTVKEVINALDYV